jgi:L-aspartate oxidase
VYEGVMVDKLLRDQGRIIGVRAWMDEGRAPKPVHILAQDIVLATGGLGNLYQVTTNPSDSHGSGLGMAAQIGARISDPEFVQFHPTAFALGGDPAPLLTEALRGEGARLLNSCGERFMTHHHPDGELAPRDIVARGIFEEIQHGRGAFLHISMTKNELEKRFPKAYEACRSAGHNPEKPIPIVPAAHYHMGGIWTDQDGHTSCPGLWAVGEVASTGAHGANRLASNSLLEAVVFGARTATALRQKTETEPHRQAISFHTADSSHELPPEILSSEDQALIAALRQTMHQHVGVIRTEAGLIESFNTLWKALESTDRPILLNRLYAALFISVGALKRQESRGTHYRLDFPEQRPDFAYRTHLSLEEIYSYGSSLLDYPAKSAFG